ncbi:MAG: hypothetical protein II323_05055 [Tidjanibacter sp.]|nr:hypothetical protein [Tidjanibacter sp.]
MIKLDKIKLVTHIDYIQIDNENAFEKIIRNNNIVQLKYHQQIPSLYIELDFLDNELVIEFSGKILGKDYHKLISKDTIKQCFENINSIGICTLNVECILNDSVVVKCDVTHDVVCEDIPQLTAFVSGNICSYRNYVCRQMRNGNFVVEKNVTTKQYKKRLTIYDKDKEMKKNENRRFAREYDVDESVFKSKCRFEMNLNSVAQIKSALGIESNDLQSVLGAQRNPIAEFLGEVIADGAASVGGELSPKDAYLIPLVLKDCNYDLAQVEAKMRSIYSKGTNISKIMKPYREALFSIQHPTISKEKIIQMLT